MYKYLRMASLAATVAALATSPALAAPTTATADPQATAQVRILKPLTLTATQNLDLGTVALGQTPFSTVVGITKAGVFTCDATKVTCSGTTQVASYHVTGTATRDVTITSGPVTLSNGTDNLPFTVDAPATVTLDNTGVVDFDVGGSVTLTDTTPDGLYQGDFDITADYQ